MLQQQEAQLFWLWFPIPQSYIPVWDGYGLQSPCSGHLTSQLYLPSTPMEWARGSKDVYCSLQVRAASSALWALREALSSLEQDSRVTERPPVRWAPVTLEEALPSWREPQMWAALWGDSTPVLLQNCSVAQQEWEVTWWKTLSEGGRELGSNTEDAIKSSREDKMRIFP